MMEVKGIEAETIIDTTIGTNIDKTTDMITDNKIVISIDTITTVISIEAITTSEETSVSDSFTH
jgi:hypothetical protein